MKKTPALSKRSQLALFSCSVSEATEFAENAADSLEFALQNADKTEEIDWRFRADRDPTDGNGVSRKLSALD